MTILEAVIQGVIQGATEFLPVSSSGHLSISQHIFGIELPGILFDIMLHLVTLVAVVFVYRGLIWRLIKEFFSLLGDVFRGRFKWADMSPDRRLIFMLIIGLLPLFLLFLPIPGTDMKIKDLSEQLASDSTILTEGLALLATSALLFLGIWAGKPLPGPALGKRCPQPPGGADHRGCGGYRYHPVPGSGISWAEPFRLHHVRGPDAGGKPAGRPGL